MNRSHEAAPGGSAVLRDVPAEIFYLGKPSTPAAIDLVRRSPAERTRRAALGLAACWGLAIGAVFIPVLHFILVPSLLLAGPLVARSRWIERATVLSARGNCPGCGKPQDVQLGQRARAEMPWRCADCGRPLSLRLTPALVDDAASPSSSTENR